MFLGRDTFEFQFDSPEQVSREIKFPGFLSQCAFPHEKRAHEIALQWQQFFSSGDERKRERESDEEEEGEERASVRLSLSEKVAHLFGARRNFHCS